MAGQGYHLGMAKLIANRLNKNFSVEMRIGTLTIDSLNVPAGNRRCSHFTGGAGCIIPRYQELRGVSKLQSWDNGFEKSYLVDPDTDLELFEITNRHIPEGDYKIGLRMHLICDKAWDLLIRQLFDFSKQASNIVICRDTGENIDGAIFRKELYSIYPMLDQYVMDRAGISAQDVQDTNQFINAVMTDEMATFLKKYLNFNPNLKWEDSKLFNKSLINTLISDILSAIEKNNF